MLTINPVANNQNYTNLSFGIFLPKKVFTDIRDIPCMKCGCCGDDMFTSDETKAFINSFAAGSKRALENSAMARYRGTPAFEFLQSLSEIRPKDTIAKLLSVDENKAKLKTLGDRTRLDVNMMSLISEGITVKAPRFMQKLEKYRAHFGAEDAEILNLMDVYALKYPKKTFAEIFNMPEVIEYHREIAALDKKQAAAKKIEVFKQLREFGQQKLLPADRKALQDTNTKAMSILNYEFFEADIKKGLIDDLYNSFVDSAKTRFWRKNLMKIVDELPIPRRTPDDFVVHCVESKKTDKDIITYFAKSLQATYEHFIPRSKEGADIKENIIILCGKCNHRRSNLPYPFFLRFAPEMMNNLQKQFNKIITFIKHGKLIGYDDYPIVMKENVLNGSDNLIRLQIRDYLDFRKERAVKQVERTQAALVRDDDRINSASGRISEIDEKIKELEVQIRKLKKERQPLKTELEDAKEVYRASQLDAEDAKAELNSINDSIAQDRETNAILKYKRRNLKK